MAHYYCHEADRGRMDLPTHGDDSNTNFCLCPDLDIEVERDLSLVERAGVLNAPELPERLPAAICVNP